MSIHICCCFALLSSNYLFNNGGISKNKNDGLKDICNCPMMIAIIEKFLLFASYIDVHRSKMNSNTLLREYMGHFDVHHALYVINGTIQ